MDSDGDGMGDNEQKELEDEAAARMQLMIIIGVVLVLAIVGGLLFMRRKNGDSMEPKETTPLPQADSIQPAQECTQQHPNLFNRWSLNQRSKINGQMKTGTLGEG